MARGEGETGWLIEPLVRSHDRSAFSCGKETLDRYLKHQAGQDARRHAAAPFVLVSAGSRVVAGYYTLCAFGIDLGELPDDVARRLPRYPVVPATLLGRLAVDRSHKGQGHGERLLVDALQRAWTQADRIAAAAVVVDAIDADAARFCRHYGFLPFPERGDRLFLPMKTVAALLAAKA